MDSKRNCIVELTDYIQSLGVTVNVGKNKARGNKGFFCTKSGCYRIDISNSIEVSSVLPTLLHEFAHFLHYRYDSSLKSLDFIFPNLSVDEEEELLKITVKNVPKDFAKSLYEQKEMYASENKKYISILKNEFPDFKVSKPLLKLEQGLQFGFIFPFEHSEVQSAYIKLKTNLKIISRINAKINKINKYYNQPSELWARFFEFYFCHSKEAFEYAPLLSARFSNIVISNNITEITCIYDILKHYLQ